AVFFHLKSALRDDPAFLRSFVAVPGPAALLRDTYTPTMPAGSPKTNVIPATATAEIDGRILPGDDPQADLDAIKKVIDDDSIKVDITLNFPAVSSPR